MVKWRDYNGNIHVQLDKIKRLKLTLIITFKSTQPFSSDRTKVWPTHLYLYKYTCYDHDPLPQQTKRLRYL